jgi:hypothetical protein
MSDQRSFVRRAGFASACIFLFEATLVAQRFDLVTSQPGTAQSPIFETGMATHPVTGEVFVCDRSNSNVPRLRRWNGSTFVTELTNPPSFGAYETLVPFRNGNVAGLAHVAAFGTNRTMIRTGSSWTTLNTTTAPVGRVLAAATSSTDANGAAYVYGGFDATNNPAATLHRFDGVQWTQITWAGQGPGPRFWAGLAHDGTGGLVLVGGDAFGSQFADAWRFHNGAWSQLPDLPSAMAGCTAVLDPRGQIVVTTGYGPGFVNDRIITMDTIGPNAFSGWTVQPPVLDPIRGGWGVSGYDLTRSQLVVGDVTTNTIDLSKVASALPVAASPTTNCVVNTLRLAGNSGTPHQPVGAALVLQLEAGLTPAMAGNLLALCGAFVAPGQPTGITFGGSSCATFLPPSATITIQSLVAPNAAAQVLPLQFPPTFALVGLLLDFQTFGLTSSQLSASNVLRVGFGQL